VSLVVVDPWFEAATPCTNLRSAALTRKTSSTIDINVVGLTGSRKHESA
jgi:hypothetical protein